MIKVESSDDDINMFVLIVILHQFLHCLFFSRKGKGGASMNKDNTGDNPFMVYLEDVAEP
jgi:hypothetical protein